MAWIMITPACQQGLALPCVEAGQRFDVWVYGHPASAASSDLVQAGVTYDEFLNGEQDPAEYRHTADLYVPNPELTAYRVSCHVSSTLQFTERNQCDFATQWKRKRRKRRSA